MSQADRWRCPMDLTRLPADLPRPLDDGGARQLPGLALPSVLLPATSGEWSWMGDGRGADRCGSG